MAMAGAALASAGEPPETGSRSTTTETHDQKDVTHLDAAGIRKEITHLLLRTLPPMQMDSPSAYESDAIDLFERLANLLRAFRERPRRERTGDHAAEFDTNLAAFLVNSVLEANQSWPICKRMRLAELEVLRALGGVAAESDRSYLFSAVFPAVAKRCAHIISLGVRDGAERSRHETGGRVGIRIAFETLMAWMTSRSTSAAAGAAAPLLNKNAAAPPHDVHRPDHAEPLGRILVELVGSDLAVMQPSQPADVRGACARFYSLLLWHLHAHATSQPSSAAPLSSSSAATLPGHHLRPCLKPLKRNSHLVALCARIIAVGAADEWETVACESLACEPGAQDLGAPAAQCIAECVVRDAQQHASSAYAFDVYSAVERLRSAKEGGDGYGRFVIELQGVVGKLQLHHMVLSSRPAGTTEAEALDPLLEDYSRSDAGPPGEHEDTSTSALFELVGLLIPLDFQARFPEPGSECIERSAATTGSLRDEVRRQLLASLDQGQAAFLQSGGRPFASGSDERCRRAGASSPSETPARGYPNGANAASQAPTTSLNATIWALRSDIITGTMSCLPLVYIGTRDAGAEDQVVEQELSTSTTTPATRTATAAKGEGIAPHPQTPPTRAPTPKNKREEPRSRPCGQPQQLLRSEFLYEKDSGNQRCAKLAKRAVRLLGVTSPKFVRWVLDSLDKVDALIFTHLQRPGAACSGDHARSGQEDPREEPDGHDVDGLLQKRMQLAICLCWLLEGTEGLMIFGARKAKDESATEGLQQDQGHRAAQSVSTPAPHLAQLLSVPRLSALLSRWFSDHEESVLSAARVGWQPRIFIAVLANVFARFAMVATAWRRQSEHARKRPGAGAADPGVAPGGVIYSKLYALKRTVAGVLGRALVPVLAHRAATPLSALAAHAIFLTDDSLRRWWASVINPTATPVEIRRAFGAGQGDRGWFLDLVCANAEYLLCDISMQLRYGTKTLAQEDELAVAVEAACGPTAHDDLLQRPAGTLALCRCVIGALLAVDDEMALRLHRQQEDVLKWLATIASELLALHDFVNARERYALVTGVTAIFARGIRLERGKNEVSILAGFGPAEREALGMTATKNENVTLTSIGANTAGQRRGKAPSYFEGYRVLDLVTNQINEDRQVDDEYDPLQGFEDLISSQTANLVTPKPLLQSRLEMKTQPPKPTKVSTRFRYVFESQRRLAAYALLELRHYLDYPDLRSPIAARAISFCVEVLSTSVKELLPLLHKLWPCLLQAFAAGSCCVLGGGVSTTGRGGRDFVFANACSLLKGIVCFSGDFLVRRFETDLWPELWRKLFVDKFRYVEALGLGCGPLPTVDRSYGAVPALRLLSSRGAPATAAKTRTTATAIGNIVVSDALKAYTDRVADAHCGPLIQEVEKDALFKEDSDEERAGNLCELSYEDAADAKSREKATEREVPGTAATPATMLLQETSKGTIKTDVEDAEKVKQSSEIPLDLVPELLGIHGAAQERSHEAALELLRTLVSISPRIRKGSTTTNVNPEENDDDSDFLPHMYFDDADHRAQLRTVGTLYSRVAGPCSEIAREILQILSGEKIIQSSVCEHDPEDVANRHA